jgi:hypothetical protein
MIIANIISLSKRTLDGNTTPCDRQSTEILLFKQMHINTCDGYSVKNELFFKLDWPMFHKHLKHFCRTLIHPCQVLGGMVVALLLTPLRCFVRPSSETLEIWFSPLAVTLAWSKRTRRVVFFPVFLVLEITWSYCHNSIFFAPNGTLFFCFKEEIAGFRG